MRSFRDSFSGLLAAVIVMLVTKKPGKEVEELFDKAVRYED